MRITIIALGSQGDVQPYVVLAMGLKGAGNDVRLATHTSFELMVRDHGLGFSPVGGNPRDMLGTESGQAFLETGRSTIAFVRLLKSMASDLIQRILSDSWNACQDADAIVHSPFGFGGFYFSQKLRVPSIGAYIQPLTRTHAFPSIMMPQVRLGRLYNWWSHILFEQLLWQTFRPSANKWAEDNLGLPRLPFAGDFGMMHRKGYPVVYGFSPTVVPKPPDWGDSIRVTGYWFLDRPPQWQPPSDLVDFLQSGPPPVCVGFGSMGNRNPEEVTGIVLEALDRCKVRGVLITGWGGLGKADLPDHVFRIESIPHDWLFPQMAAVVHHGGAGTTAAALRAGVPSVIVPFAADQPFWADRVVRLGAGPKPIPRKQLSVDRLARAIAAAVSDKDMQNRAAAIGVRIRAENGVAEAVGAIGSYLSSGQRW